MLAGFVHGVLNTDNINVTGESFDYGPWRFLPTLDPAFTAAYFDDTGLYAYGRQPDTLLWNLTRLAECLLPFAGQAELEAALGGFAPQFQAAFNAALLRRLGLQSAGETADTELVRALWKFMLESKAPFEQVFFDWYGGAQSAERAPERVRPHALCVAGLCPGRSGAGRLRAGARHPARPSLFRAKNALHHADRPGREHLDADRRGRRLVRLSKAGSRISPKCARLIRRRRKPEASACLAGRRACASICRIAMTRRRQISVRIAITCSVRNSTVKPSAITSSGHSMLGSMVGPPMRNTEAGWCSVFHQSTENLMIGMLMKPTSVMMAAARADFAGSSMARVSARMPRYIRNSTKTEVSRASHTHQVPHIGLPQIEPVSSASAVNTAPMGAARFQRHVGQRVAPDQRAERGNRHQRVAHHGEPRERHVDIHDPHRDALLEVLRRREGEIEPDRQKQRRDACHPRHEPVGQRHEPCRVGKVDPAPGAFARFAHERLHSPDASGAAIGPVGAACRVTER